MAITVGNTSNKQHENQVSASTLSHTINSGINRILFVMVSEMNFDSKAVTYNGTAMTKLLDQTSGTRHMSLWYMLEADLPAGGAYNIGVNSGGNRQYGQVFAHCFSNAEQTAPFASASGASGTGQTSFALTLNSLRNGDVIIYGASIPRGSGTSNTWTPAVDYTEWFDAANDGLPLGLPASSTGIRRALTASGNYSPSSTSSGNGTIYAVAVAFHPAEDVLGGPIWFF